MSLSISLPILGSTHGSPRYNEDNSSMLFDMDSKSAPLESLKECEKMKEVNKNPNQLNEKIGMEVLTLESQPLPPSKLTSIHMITENIVVYTAKIFHNADD